MHANLRRFRVQRTIALFVALGAGAAACKSEPKVATVADVLPGYEPKIKAQLEKIRGIDRRVPPTTTDGVRLPDRADPKFDPPSYDGATLGLMVYDADFADPAAAASDKHRITLVGSLEGCEKYVGMQSSKDWGSRSLSPASDVERLLRQCASATYLGIIRVNRKRAPKISDAAKKEFVGGAAEGDVLFFDVATGKHLGGYAWKASTDSSMADYASRAQDKLDDNFTENIYKAIAAGFSKNISGGTLPHTMKHY
jgi:hypothetical protein